ncbi:hypothetical protein Pint_14342 [Pistacia integerrima]|uniref:Uncharacterized protein n=1 Tax=Pistacia integerrima TaxID=434235 RepID=A0ACC0YC72_9ROSI|nr:hypothetical protein Pint_14342 [Pistacia integerrima]
MGTWKLKRAKVKRFIICSWSSVVAAVCMIT